MFIVFFYFTHNQFYAARHFTGASKGAPVFLMIMSLICIVLEIAFVIKSAIQNSVLLAIILVIAALVVLNIIKFIICRIVMHRITSDSHTSDLDNATLLNYYNRQLDITTTIQALIGIIVNPIIIALYFVFFN